MDDKTRQIAGKGHNILVQEGHPYNHGETAAMRDAGREDFSKCTIFTTLTPCSICTELISMREFKRVVIGNALKGVNAANERKLRGKKIDVEILEDALGKALYAQYQREKPDQDLEDWKGLAAVNRKKLRK